MSALPKLGCLFVLLLTLGFVGCEAGGGGSEAEAPAQNELQEFLQDNPDVANAKEAVPEEPAQ